MGWYKLIFKQNQPIHIGSAKWGVVKETGIFITGQTMWGALTNYYAVYNKDFIKKCPQDEASKLFEKITNFFPSFDGENILKPNYKYEEFYLGNIPEDKFRFLFVDTIVQTAIETISRQAKDESLHEFDFILPKPKRKLCDFKDYLYWIGLIFIQEEDFFIYIKEKEDIKELFKKIFKTIYIGGDAKYGFGELELIDVKNINNDELKYWQINNDNIKIKNGNTLYFIEVDLVREFEGEIQLIPEFDFRHNIPIVKDAKFFISVGSKVKSVEKPLVSLKKGKIYAKNS